MQYIGNTEIMVTKKAATFRLSPLALGLLARLAKQSGISQAAVLELAIRKYSGDSRRP